MKSLWRSKAMIRLAIPSTCLAAVGGCLTDAQVTQILQSVISTGLNTLITTFVTALFQAGTAAGA